MTEEKALKKLIHVMNSDEKPTTIGKKAALLAGKTDSILASYINGDDTDLFMYAAPLLRFAYRLLDQIEKLEDRVKELEDNQHILKNNQE